MKNKKLDSFEFEASCLVEKADELSKEDATKFIKNFGSRAGTFVNSQGNEHDCKSFDIELTVKVIARYE
ncbi:hypothetical protein [Photobacterium alginatilyticum]|uniref:Uncharacterized protein n=1 Tax=Photobacterium alginatilyticum TaxID=1775171 RepID=A0ABW9YK39_9GAMM|nr:hypothetical protein [Photobacterium alginatilyticum]NBI53449.1 hypothetical protein [Photobacterium alginatilyticum]